MFALRSRSHRIAHWIGAATATAGVGMAAWILSGLNLPHVDADERNELVGGAIFMAGAGLAGYGLIRMIGWAVAEIMD